jgi:hypothetical protein
MHTIRAIRPAKAAAKGGWSPLKRLEPSATDGLVVLGTRSVSAVALRIGFALRVAFADRARTECWALETEAAPFIFDDLGGEGADRLKRLGCKGKAQPLIATRQLASSDVEDPLALRCRSKAAGSSIAGDSKAPKAACSLQAIHFDDHLVLVDPQEFRDLTLGSRPLRTSKEDPELTKAQLKALPRKPLCARL